MRTLEEVGLGYIRLGQSAVTFSGGEAQRIKIAEELSRRDTGSTLYILDEPTTGLHFDDVAALMKVLRKLTALGNTVIVIEHNLDVIRLADWIVDIGPDGGARGGELVVEGPADVIAACPASLTGKYLREELARTGVKPAKRVRPAKRRRHDGPGSGRGRSDRKSLMKRVPPGVKAVGLTHAALDLTDESALWSALESYSPEAVINAAAYTAVDRAETESAAAFAVNARAPELIAHWCRMRVCPSFISAPTTFLMAQKRGLYGSRSRFAR